jgi:hypothetical protein
VDRLEGPAVAERIAQVARHAAAVVQDAQVQAPTRSARRG